MYAYVCMFVCVCIFLGFLETESTYRTDSGRYALHTCLRVLDNALLRTEYNIGTDADTEWVIPNGFFSVFEFPAPTKNLHHIYVRRQRTYNA